MVLRLPDLGGCGRWFKQPLTPKTHHVLRLACTPRLIVVAKEPRLLPKSTLSVSLFPIVDFLLPPVPPISGGGDWLPISSVTIALPIVRAHIHPSPYPHPQRPYRRHPALDYLTPKPNRSCLYYSCKKLYYSQSATTLNLAAESCTPEWQCYTSLS